MTPQTLVGDFLQPFGHITGENFTVLARTDQGSLSDSAFLRYAFEMPKLDELSPETMLQSLWAAAYRIPMVSLKPPPTNHLTAEEITAKPTVSPRLRDMKTAFSGRCPSCDKVYKSKKDLQDHIIIHHERKYECERCTRTFVSEKRMRTHQLKKHSVLPTKKGKCDAKRKLYRCEQCGRTYETYYNFKEHLAKHDGKLFECSVCNKQLSGQSALSRHSKIHDKPHECMMCAGRFSSAYDLDCHFSYYHSAIKRFKCEHCERVLYNYSGKLRHERLCAARPQPSYVGLQQHKTTPVQPSIPVTSAQSAAEKSDPRADLPNKPDMRAEKSDISDNTAQEEKSEEKMKRLRSTFHIRDILCDIPEFRNEYLNAPSGIVS